MIIWSHARRIRILLWQEFSVAFFHTYRNFERNSLSEESVIPCDSLVVRGSALSNGGNSAKEVSPKICRNSVVVLYKIGRPGAATNFLY
jgi:hypothetical protein